MKTATIETSRGTITAELFDTEVPGTVANFEKLANERFYDGTRFHRVIQDFMIQGGDPLSRDPRNPRVGTGGEAAGTIGRSKTFSSFGAGFGSDLFSAVTTGSGSTDASAGVVTAGTVGSGGTAGAAGASTGGWCETWVTTGIGTGASTSTTGPAL